MPDPRPLTKRGGTRMEARRGLRWRLLAHHQAGPGKMFSLDVHPSQGLAFDELVVHPWLHIEQIDDGLWHAIIGPLHMDVSVDESGVTRLTGWWDTPGCWDKEGTVWKAPELVVPEGVA